MERYIPIGLSLIHALISALGNLTTLPVVPVAGWEKFSLVLALLCAASGTILGFINLPVAWRASVIIAVLCGTALAWFGYSKIIGQGGATDPELLLLLFFYLVIFLGVFYLLTQFERLVAILIKP